MSQSQLNQRIQQWIRPDIQALAAYHVPDSSGLIKLDAMENPYSLNEATQALMSQAIQDAAINRYPDAECVELKNAIRGAFGIDDELDILLGNGSDEIIQMLIMAMAQPGACVLAPEPTFVMYKMISLFANVEFRGVTLQDDFSLDLPAMLAAIEQHQPALVFLAYPNNPSGNLFARADIQSIIEAAPGVVVLDEAYHAFADASFMDDLRDYDNLLVMRTVSKMGLAGLRLGYLVGRPQWLEQINKVRLPYNINSLTQKTALTALNNIAVFNDQTAKIKSARETLAQQLAAIGTIDVFTSAANFILIRVPDADNVFSALKNHGILIKKLHGQHELLAQCLRITVGTPVENAATIKALQQILSCK
jgi:histidinol-phosphate aminotransferase